MFTPSLMLLSVSSTTPVWSMPAVGLEVVRSVSCAFSAEQAAQRNGVGGVRFDARGQCAGVFQTPEGGLLLERAEHQPPLLFVFRRDVSFGAQGRPERSRKCPPFQLRAAENKKKNHGGRHAL
jgi:hypothetical protein